MAPVGELVLMDLDRSNKGASKQRRDQINAEINILRDLLPLPDSSRQRLSQLQVMSLSCVYIRKCNILQKLFRSQSQEPHLPDSLDFFQAMTGFLLVTTREGKLIYISENVTDYLGHSMVDMKTQGDSLYDIVDKRDHAIVQAKLLQGGALDSKDIISQDVSFFCRMNMSRTLKRQSGFGDVKVMHIQGHFVAVFNPDNRSCLTDQQYVFMASCSPLITPDLKETLVLNNTKVFKTVHQLDMGFVEVTKIAEHHLGYSSDELYKTSWYSMIHPEDIHEAKEKHTQLVRSNHVEIGSMMTVRMLKADGSFFWVNIVMHVKQTLLGQNDEPYIICINQIISAQEAYQIRRQSQMFFMYPGRVKELWGNHMPSTSPNHNFNVNQWVQQEGNSSVPVPGFPNNVPNFPNHSRYQVMYPTACSSMAEIERGRVTGQYDLPNLVQTDKLKAMLKRKIQGPTMQTECSSGKVPKMSWNTDGSSDTNVHQEMEKPSRLYGKEKMSHTVAHSGQVVQVMMATNHSPGMYVPKNVCTSVPEMIPNVITDISNRVKVEQVVPDINVPDSYLTPDPSPISSPEPSNIKTEVMDPNEVGTSGTSSVCIFQALEKLASQPQESLQAKFQMSTTTKPSCGKSGRKELPIFDASDIESFFDMLNVPDNYSKATTDSKQMHYKKYNRTDLISQPLDTTPNIELQFPTLKNERELKFIAPESNLDDNFISQISPNVALSVKTELEDTDIFSFQTRNRKDIVVSSTMIHSPESISSQETMKRTESLEDLLNCFSDEGLDTSPFPNDSNISSVNSSVFKFTAKDPLDFRGVSPFNSPCQMPFQYGGKKAIEELSPQSISSGMSRDDEIMEKSWNFGMELESLDANSELESSQHLSIKQKDNLEIDDVFDQVGILLDSLVPSQGSF